MFRTVIHAGLPKTATTTLQQGLFASAGELEYLGPPYADKIGHDFLKQLFSQPKDEEIDYDAVRSHLAPYQQRARESARPFLISDEAIGNHTKVRLGRKLARFEQVLGASEWIFVIRRPLDMLESHYLWEMRCIEFNTGRFFMPFDRWFRNRWRRIHRNHIAVISIGEHLQPVLEALDRDRLHVLPFEWLRQQPQRFYGELADITGLPAQHIADRLRDQRHNSRMSRLQFDFVSRLSRRNFGSPAAMRATIESFLGEQSISIEPDLLRAIEQKDSRNTRKQIFRIFDAIEAHYPEAERMKVEIPESVREAVLNRSLPGTRRLGLELDLDLESLGYFDPDPPPTPSLIDRMLKVLHRSP